MTTRHAVSGLLLSALLVFAARGPAAAEEQRPSAPPLLGAQGAKHTFVVWGSFTCPYTIQLIAMLANIAKDSNGTVNVQWRHLPAHGPDPLLHAVSLADAARFWPFATQVMTKFSSGSNPAKWTWDDIVAMGKAAGLTEEQLAKARDDEANWETLRQDYLAAKLLHIDKTPGLFYDGYFLTPDGLPLDTASFDKSLRAMVKVAGPKPK